MDGINPLGSDQFTETPADGLIIWYTNGFFLQKFREADCGFMIILLAGSLLPRVYIRTYTNTAQAIGFTTNQTQTGASSGTPPHLPPFPLINTPLVAPQILENWQFGSTLQIE
jgi:hypothetical protein